MNEQAKKVSEKVVGLNKKRQKAIDLNSKINIIEKNQVLFKDELKKAGVLFLEILNNFKKDIDEIFSKGDDDNLDFKIDISFKEKYFEKSIKDIFDNRNFSNCEIPEIVTSSYNYSEDFILLLIDQVLLEDKLKLKVEKKDALSSLLKNYYNVNYLVSMDNDDVNTMSPGKKSQVLLRLLIEMSESNWPILIDQPEDDLDNRTIYTDLVEYIKTKKQDRQIIIVTHNANIVVGADSEQIIIANQDGNATKNNKNRFEYRSGSIEDNMPDKTKKGVLYNKGINEQICEILEGGERAFELRTNKYLE